MPFPLNCTEKVDSFSMPIYKGFFHDSFNCFRALDIPCLCDNILFRIRTSYLSDTGTERTKDSANFKPAHCHQQNSRDGNVNRVGHSCTGFLLCAQSVFINRNTSKWTQLQQPQPRPNFKPDSRKSWKNLHEGLWENHHKNSFFRKLVLHFRNFFQDVSLCHLKQEPPLVPQLVNQWLSPTGFRESPYLGMLKAASVLRDPTCAER